MEIVKFSFTHLGIDWFLHVEPPVIKVFYHVFAAHVRHGRPFFGLDPPRQTRQAHVDFQKNALILRNLRSGLMFGGFKFLRGSVTQGYPKKRWCPIFLFKKSIVDLLFIFKRVVE